MSYGDWKRDSSAPGDQVMQQGLFEIDFNFYFVLVSISFTLERAGWQKEKKENYLKMYSKYCLDGLHRIFG